MWVTTPDVLFTVLFACLLILKLGPYSEIQANLTLSNSPASSSQVLGLQVWATIPSYLFYTVLGWNPGLLTCYASTLLTEPQTQLSWNTSNGDLVSSWDVLSLQATIQGLVQKEFKDLSDDVYIDDLLKW